MTASNAGRIIGRLLPVQFALVPLLWPLAVSAHLPEYFGRFFVLAPADAQTVPVAETPNSRAEQAQLEYEIDRLRAGAGAYDSALADPLMQLATLQARSGNAVGAMQNLEEAIHLLRVNNGLLHPVQLPLLRQLAEAYRGIGDSKSAFLAHRYIYRIHGEGDRPLDEEALSDVLAYFAAARDHAIDPRIIFNEQLLTMAYYDSVVLYDALRENFPEGRRALREVGLSQLRFLYILMGINISLDPIRGENTPTGRDQLLRLQQMGFGKGLKVLGALLEDLGSDDEMLRAELLLERANWLQWNGKPGRAGDDYRRLMQIVAGREDAAALRERLATPALIPEDPAIWRSLQHPDIADRALVRASFRVSVRGDASAVETAVEGDAPPGLAGRVRRMIIDCHIRPALSDSGPVQGYVEGRLYRLIN